MNDHGLGLGQIGIAVADFAPSDVWAQLLAADGPASGSCQLLDEWTELRGDSLAHEVLDALPADRTSCTSGHCGFCDECRSFGRTFEDLDCQRGPFARGLVHTPDTT